MSMLNSAETIELARSGKILEKHSGHAGTSSKKDDGRNVSVKSSDDLEAVRGRSAFEHLPAIALSQIAANIIKVSADPAAMAQLNHPPIYYYNYVMKFWNVKQELETYAYGLELISESMDLTYHLIAAIDGEIMFWQYGRKRQVSPAVMEIVRFMRFLEASEDLKKSA